MRVHARPTARVIGVGRRFAGDDAVGLLVIQHLRALRIDGLELIEAGSPTDLIELLQTSVPVVLVDAVVGQRPAGTVERIELDRLDGPDAPRFSSHGIGVDMAIELARLLAPPGRFPEDLRLVGVYIDPPEGYGTILHAPVRAAIPAAARQIQDLCRGRAAA